MNRLLVFGDSITWGAWDSEGGWATRLKKYTDNQAIKNDVDDYDTVYPLGISGDTTNDLLKRLEAELINRIDVESNTVVIIAIGINDSQLSISDYSNEISLEDFNKNFQAFFKIIKNNNVKDIIIVGLNPVDENLVNPMPWKPTHGYTNEQIRKYDNYLQQFSNENKLLFINIYDCFENTDDYKKLLSDGLHPNDKGHVLIFNEVLDKLKSLELLK
jgi:lysophospholipase L1-like esterase